MVVNYISAEYCMFVMYQTHIYIRFIFYGSSSVGFINVLVCLHTDT
jgi:hypothetical protein